MDTPFGNINGPGIMCAEPHAVCDGDTFRVRWHPTCVIDERWRLADVDASGRGRTGWTAATQALRDWLRHPYLTAEWAYDRPAARGHANRPLVYLWADGLLINEEIIRSGLTRVVRKHTDTRHWARCAEAEKAARTARIGIWQGNPPPIQSG
jgi:micrococcal nuclease